MLCNLQDVQAESSPVLSEADARKRFNLACTGAIKAGLYLLCNNDDVQYFCHVREKQLWLYLIFRSIKMHMYGKQSALSHKKPVSHQNISKFPSPSYHSFSPGPTTQDQNNS